MPMPPIKKSVAQQNPSIENLNNPNEEQAKIAAGRNPSPTSMKDAVMLAVGKAPPPPIKRPGSMKEAVKKAAKRKRKKKS